MMLSTQAGPSQSDKAPEEEVTNNNEELSVAREEGVEGHEYPRTTPQGHTNSTDLRNYTIKKDECIAIPDDANPNAREAMAGASFGDRGTTASVTSRGQIVQITRYLGTGTSGFFCAGLDGVLQPYSIASRAEQLMNLATMSYGIGCSTTNDLPKHTEEVFNVKPTLEFVRDRWPRFSAETQDLLMTTQFFVHQHTVYEQSTFHTKKGALSLFHGLMVWKTIVIHELDFTNSQHKFNKAELSDDEYEMRIGSDASSLILTHTGSASEHIEGMIALCIVVFINGRPQKFYEDQYEEDRAFRVQLRDEDSTVECSKPLEITTAFKLQLLPQNGTAGANHISTPSYCNLEMLLATSPWTRLRFVSEDAHLDFAIRRNLENILSVCCIPVNAEYVSSESSSKERGKDQMIAFTCGDISGHRLVNSASFYAFEFLLSICNYLEELQERNGYSNHTVPPTAEADECHRLRERIRITCEAHLTWLFERIKTSKGCFAANYWATGEIITTSESSGDLSKASLSDTPFQIIKLGDYVDNFGDATNAKRDWGAKLLKDVARQWVGNLENANKRGKYALVRPVDRNFRLDDHVWIWRALKAIEGLGLGEQPNPKVSISQNRVRHDRSLKKDSFGSDETGGLLQNFSPVVFQREVLKRFTTEDPTSKQRMIAVTRGPAETRFLFHARDTALFQETKLPFLEASNVLWKATIESQKFHEENEDYIWDNPLRYGLALLMSSKNLQMNERPVEEMFQTAKGVLFGASSPNGLFSGQVNNATKEPELYVDARWRDFYWHVSFEVPYLIWAYGKKLPRAMGSPGSAKSGQQAIGDLLVQVRQPEIGATPIRTATQMYAEERPPDRVSAKMKKVIPSNTLLDQTSIVELSEEWLYDYPDFFDFDPQASDNSEIFETIAEIAKIDVKILQPSIVLEFLHWAMEECWSQQDDLSLPVFLNKDPVGLIMDIPKSTHTKIRGSGEQLSRYPELTVSPCSNEELYQELKEKRSENGAKKRFLWLPSWNAGTALLCFLASPTSGQNYLAPFFHHNHRKEKFFSDDATATSNFWTTELNLSCYSIVKNVDDPRQTKLKFFGEETRMEMISMGFLFIGDFFDRYWTCYVLESSPEKSRIREMLSTAIDGYDSRDWPQFKRERFKNIIRPRYLPPTDPRERPWQQRKILELLLLDYILQSIEEQYETMFQEIKEHLIKYLSADQANVSESWDLLEVSNALFSSAKMNNRTYRSFSKRWPPIQYTLQAMENDLTKIIEKLELWAAREKDRKQEKPRWTNNDERKYRPAIIKVSQRNAQKTRDLEHRLSEICSLRVSLTRELEFTRDELSFQSADHVKFFTYMTSVFLPLAFATSIFSMDDPPNSQQLSTMVVVAVIAVSLTYMFLILGRQIFQKIEWISVKTWKIFPLGRHAHRKSTDDTLSQPWMEYLNDTWNELRKRIAKRAGKPREDPGSEAQRDEQKSHGGTAGPASAG